MSNKESKPDFLNDPFKQKEEFSTSLNINPKISVGKLLTEGDLEIKSVIVKGSIHKEFIEDSVSIDFKINADLAKERVNSAEIKFTKKF